METIPPATTVGFEHDGETSHTVEIVEVTETHSIVRVRLRGITATVRNTGSDTEYAIIEGNGVMVIDGVEHDLYPGAVVEVPRGSTYYAAGDYHGLAMCIPPFDASTVVTTNS